MLLAGHLGGLSILHFHYNHSASIEDLTKLDRVRDLGVGPIITRLGLTKACIPSVIWCLRSLVSQQQPQDKEARASWRVAATAGSTVSYVATSLSGGILTTTVGIHTCLAFTTVESREWPAREGAAHGSPH